MIGRQVRDYLIEAQIGRGGMARVYRAQQTTVNRLVAIKMIATDHASEDEQTVFRERFAREAKLIASLEHTHILPVYDYGIIEGQAYIVMRLLGGGSLAHVLRNGFLPLPRVCQIFGQVARGLAYAHSQGVIHRDLKPANILFASNGDAFLTDFGLAKWIEDAPNLTQSGKMVGTPAYMSPEQLRGEPIDQRSDIYGMGIILYQMVTGQLPFDSQSGEVVAVIYQHLEKSPPPPTEINPDLLPAVEQIIFKALAKNPDERYASILQMADELELALGQQPSGSYTSVQTSAVAASPLYHKRLKISVALVLLLLLLMGLEYMVLRPRPAPPIIRLGQEWYAEDIHVTPSDVARAQVVLGDRFLAFVTCNQTSEYHAIQAREMRDFATAYNLDYRIYDSDTDQYAQITRIERARADGAGALIICPLDTNLLQETLDSISDAGLPLVVMSQDLHDLRGVMIAGNDYQMGYLPGELAGRIIAEEMQGQAQVIILDYPELPHLVARADGLIEGILAHAPEAQIIGRYRGATSVLGYTSVQQLLQRGTAFNVIASINDAGSFGAIRALAEFNIPADAVKIVSVDAEQLARVYISRGYYMRGSVDPGREQFSRAAVDLIVLQLAGVPVAQKVIVPPGQVITAADLVAAD